MTALRELLRSLLELSHAEREREIRKLSDVERKAIRYHWRLFALPRQLQPRGDWRTWLICAGRGFGKTPAGAEWVRWLAQHNADVRIALVGASPTEVRAVMVEGESGILAVCPPENSPLFEPSLRRLSWGIGAQAFLYSAAEPESLRGPQHHVACGAVAERILRQRGARVDRPAASYRGLGRSQRSAARSRGRRMLAGRPIGLRRAERERRLAGGATSGRGSSPRPCPAGAFTMPRPGNSFFILRAMASQRGAARRLRRDRGGQRGA